MQVNGKHWRTIWYDESAAAVCVIDQTKLPFVFEIVRLRNLADAAQAIRTMVVRGAPLIGATAAYGIVLAMAHDPGSDSLQAAIKELAATRPTAVNLRWALQRMERKLKEIPLAERAAVALQEAAAICNEDVAISRAIGEHGQNILRHKAEETGRCVNILTHCNAGWLATVDYGTALAPIYLAHDAGIDLHVWVDETRPRNQGASLTAFELAAHGVPHTIIADNAGGHLMQRGEVDLCITGTDRVAANGDTANKIGTYLKALSAKDNNIPFYVALPSTTIDWSIADGLRDIPIENRSEEEVTQITGMDSAGQLQSIRIASPGSVAANPAFDVTPARLITGFITEKGVTEASEQGLQNLFGSIRSELPA